MYKIRAKFFLFYVLSCALPIRQRSTKWIFYLKKNNYIQLFYIKRTVKKMDTKILGKKRYISDPPEPGNDPRFRIPVLAFLLLGAVSFPAAARSMAQRSQCDPNP